MSTDKQKEKSSETAKSNRERPSRCLPDPATAPFLTGSRSVSRVS
jgi:hypothetical protein